MTGNTGTTQEDRDWLEISHEFGAPITRKSSAVANRAHRAQVDSVYSARDRVTADALSWSNA